jgi:hypothetical protein
MVVAVSDSALRRLGAILAPGGPPASTTDADVDADVLAAADRHKLGPALRSALASTAASRAVDRLRVEHRRNLARNLVLAAEVKELLEALDRAGIPAAPLKGIDAVIEDVYPDPGMRTMSDLDVLVEPTAGDAAEALLADLGYEPVMDELPDHHHLTPVAAPGRVGVVEVHIGLQDRRSPAFLGAGGVLDRAARVDGRPGLRLDRTDAATHLVDHAQHAAPRRRLVLDIRSFHETSLVIERVPDVDWDVVRDRFDRAGVVDRFDAHLAATEALFGVISPVPLGRAGRWVARRELFVEDHPLVGVVDRPTAHLGRLRRERMERYYGTPLHGAAVWRARARYLGEAAGAWRGHLAGRRATPRS